MEIKIVGSIGDHDDVHLIKKVTEVFLIEHRIKDLIYPESNEK